MNVPIDRFFRVSKEVDVAGVRVTAIALGDAHLHERQRACMLAKAKLLKSLKDKDSPDYMVYLSDIEDSSDDGLRLIVSLRYQLALWDELQREITPEYIPIPDNATDDEQVETLDARQAELTRVSQARSETEKARMEKENARLESLPRDELVKEATKAQTELTVRELWTRTYQTYTILSGTRGVNGSPLFKSHEEAESIPSSVRYKLLEAVLEVTAMDPLALNGQSSTD